MLTAVLVAVLLAGAPVRAYEPNAAEETALAEFIALRTGDAPYAVKLAMAAALLNRVEDSRYPETVSGVLSAAGYKGARHTAAYDAALSAVRTAAAGMDVTDGATAWARAGSADAARLHVTFSAAGWVFGE